MNVVHVCEQCFLIFPSKDVVSKAEDSKGKQARQPKRGKSQKGDA